MLAYTGLIIQVNIYSLTYIYIEITSKFLQPCLHMYFDYSFVLLIFENTSLPLMSKQNDKKTMELHADIYSLLLRLDYIEKAFIRDAISQEEYDVWCPKLISQFKTAINLINMDFNEYYLKYSLNLTAAKLRIQQGVASQLPMSSSKMVAEIVQSFITLMDACKLGMTSIDQLSPLLSDVISGIKNIDRNYPKLTEWYSKLSTKKASDCLDEEQIRQFVFDLDNAYSLFVQQL